MLLICLVNFVPVNLWAQNEDIETIIEDAIASDDQNNIISEPNPFDLQPYWWNYFDNSEDKLASKTNNFLSNLNKLKDAISDEYKEDSKVYIRKISSSLKALSNISKTTKPESIEAPFKDTYSLDELLELNRSLYKLETIFLTELPAFKEEQKTTKDLAKEIDTLNVSYKKIDAANQEKLISGLEIISNRLAWFVATKKEPIQRELLDHQEKRINKLTKEIEIAQFNLSVNNNDLDSIDNEINKQQLAYKDKQKSYLEAQSLSLESIEDDLSDYLKSSLLKQKALLAKIQSSSEETKLNFLKAKKAVALLSQLDTDKPSNESVEQYKKLESFSKQVLKKKDEWNNSLMGEISSLIEINFGDKNASEIKNAAQISKSSSDTVRDIAKSLQKLDTSLNDLRFLNNITESYLAKTQGPLFKIRSDTTYTFSELWKGTKILFGKSLFSVSDVPVTLLNILSALLIVVIAYVISRIVRNIITRISASSDGRTSPVFYTLARLSHYIIIIVGIILALASIGLNFTNLAIVAGALSVGIGFGLQSIVNNFVSGIIVLFEQNIKVGDFVQLDSGMTGVVKGIHVRSTVITTLDNLDIIVPNSELVTAKVVNYTMNEPMFRIHVPFGVAYGSDKTIVEKAGLEAARKVEVTYDDGAKRRPQVWLTGFGDSSLDFELIVWVVNKLGTHATPGSWKALYIWEIETALHKYGIEIPFPQRDLHIKSGFTSTTEAKPDF